MSIILVLTVFFFILLLFFATLIAKGLGLGLLEIGVLWKKSETNKGKKTKFWIVIACVFVLVIIIAVAAMINGMISTPSFVSSTVETMKDIDQSLKDEVRVAGEDPRVIVRQRGNGTYSFNRHDKIYTFCAGGEWAHFDIDTKFVKRWPAVSFSFSGNDRASFIVIMEDVNKNDFRRNAVFKSVSFRSTKVMHYYAHYKKGIETAYVFDNVRRYNERDVVVTQVYSEKRSFYLRVSVSVPPKGKVYMKDVNFIGMVD